MILKSKLEYIEALAYADVLLHEVPINAAALNDLVEAICAYEAIHYPLDLDHRDN